MKKTVSILSAALMLAAPAAYAGDDDYKKIAIVHTGDFHGHLTERPNLRSNADYAGQQVGGLARVATKSRKSAAATAPTRRW